VALVPRFLSLLGETSRDPGVLVERYRPLCSLTGSEVTVHRDDGRRIVGICHGIDADGALVLDTAVGLVHLVSGSLTDPLDVWRGDRPEGHAGPAG
jgi:biotin-(acetyl-CoA carboxylase) ligase